MEKQHRFGLRKTTVGLVSAMIMGITIVPISDAGMTVASANEQDDDAEIMLINADLDDDDLVREMDLFEQRAVWYPNTPEQIRSEIEVQLAKQEEKEDSDEESLEYVIQWGDTVWGITEAYHLDMDAFVKVNNIDNPDLIYADDVVSLDVNKSVAELREEQEVAEEVVEKEVDVERTKTKSSTGGSSTTDTTNDSNETKESDEIVDDSVDAPESNDIVQNKPNGSESTGKDEVDNDIPTDEVEKEDDKDESDQDVDLEDEEVEDTEDKEEIEDEDIVEDDTDVEIPEDVDEVEDEDFDEDIIEEDEKEEDVEGEDGEEDDKDVIRTERVERSFTINHGTLYKEDDTLPKGEEVIEVVGRNGQRVETYERKFVNGVLVEENLLSDEVRIEPTMQVVRVGTQKVDVKRETVSGTKFLDEEFIETDELYVGDVQVIQFARPRLTYYYYETKIINGVEQERELVRTEVKDEGQPKISLVGTKVKEDESTDHPTSVDELLDVVVDISLFNKEYLDMVNAHRADNGVGALVYRDDLLKGANLRSKEISEHFDHTRPDGSSFRTAFDNLDDIQQRGLGENIAYNYVAEGHDDKLDLVFEGKMTYEKYLAFKHFEQFKASPGHNANMLNPSYNSMTNGLYVDNEGSYPTTNNAMILSRD